MTQQPSKTKTKAASQSTSGVGLSRIYLPDGWVPVDRARVVARMEELGINQVKLAKISGVDRTALYRMLRERTGKLDELEYVAGALKTSPAALQPASGYVEPEEFAHQLVAPRNWSIESVVSPHLMSANGVVCCVAKLRNELVPTHICRGKFYDLLKVIPLKQDELRACLTRHPSVCSLLSAQPRIAKHLDVRPLGEDTAWWVLDEWLDGICLDQLLAEETPLSFEQVKIIGQEILLALQSLHQAKIIFRELSPTRIYLSQDYSRCTLTDFEMAKLLDSQISVSGKWKVESHYRAPEVGSGEVTFKCDLYSWGTIMHELVAASGVASQLESHREAKAGIDGLLQRCRHSAPSGRYSSVPEVLALWDQHCK